MDDNLSSSSSSSSSFLSPFTFEELSSPKLALVPSLLFTVTIPADEEELGWGECLSLFSSAPVEESEDVEPASESVKPS